MKPPFKIIPKIVNLCSEISRLIGQCEGLKLSVPSPQLRRHNRIKTIHSSLSIEGNTLSESQITDIVDHKRVVGPKKDIQEVKNAIRAYQQIRKYNIYDLKSLLFSHKLLMQGLSKDAGKLRSTNVGIMKGKKVVHMAPKHNLVSELIHRLFLFLKSKDDVHPLIKSSVFHYELEFIHPFTDGNGRVGRLWQSAILLNDHSVFEFVPIESVIKKRQIKYYQALEKSDRKGDSTTFIVFMLDAIREAMEGFISESIPQTQTSKIRLTLARSHFKKRIFSRMDYIKLHKTISTATASRDLLRGVKTKILKKAGKKALTKYQFISV